jgi:hypothetical protein
MRVVFIVVSFRAGWMGRARRRAGRGNATARASGRTWRQTVGAARSIVDAKQVRMSHPSNSVRGYDLTRALPLTGFHDRQLTKQDQQDDERDHYRPAAHS